jgi:hypothetical protein|tara:strand:+ start:1330 stop:1776 length:447 start_codon:yes stop_codon:yes gene_type:complete
MSVTREDLERAVDELNDKICDPPIKKKNEEKMKKKILIAAKLIEKEDNISKETMVVIKTLKGSKPSKKEKEAKKETKTNGKTKSSAKKKAKGELSNKAIIWKEWTKKKEKVSAEDLEKLINSQVKLTTIKSWIGMWKRGAGLPGIANS